MITYQASTIPFILFYTGALFLTVLMIGATFLLTEFVIDKRREKISNGIEGNQGEKTESPEIVKPWPSQDFSGWSYLAAIIAGVVTVGLFLSYGSSEIQSLAKDYRTQIESQYKIELGPDSLSSQNLLGDWGNEPRGTVLGDKSNGTPLYYTFDGVQQLATVVFISNGDETATIYELAPGSELSLFAPSEHQLEVKE